MDLQDIFVWLGGTPPGRYLAESTVAFAIVQSVHILSFGIIGGAILALDLAGLGLIFRVTTRAQTGRQLMPIFLVALAGAAISGALLVTAGPFKYYTNPIFAWKLGLLALAIIIHLAIYPGLRLNAKERTVHQPSLVVRVLSLSSIVAWFGVAVLGRWIGLI